MTEPIIAKAIESFRSGLNCAQAVIGAYSDKLGIDKDLALSVSCGFGAGMGRIQRTCGAVTGSYMVLGIHNCKKVTDNKIRKEITYAMVQTFAGRFIQIHGTSECIELLNCDLKSEEGNLFAKENNLFVTVCEKCISDSISIVNDLIEE